MKIFVVVRSGVNDQGIVGCFSTMKRATNAADKAGEEEPDRYHSFDIREFIVDQRVNLFDGLKPIVTPYIKGTS